MANPRYRIRFTKQGDLRWCSHRDLARLWERMLRRAGLELALSEGFHPKPKISFPSALALGIESLEEYVEIELRHDIDPGLLIDTIRAEALTGMEILSIERLAPGTAKACMAYAVYEVRLPPEVIAEVLPRMEQLREIGSLRFEREGAVLATELGPRGVEFFISGDRLQIKQSASPTAVIRPAEILGALGLADWLYQGDGLRRSRVVLTQSTENERESEREFSDDSETDSNQPQKAIEGNGQE